MKAILCIGLMILGMIATEGVVTQEYEGDETLYVDPFVETDVDDEFWCQADRLFDKGEAEVLVCVDEDEQHHGNDI